MKSKIFVLSFLLIAGCVIAGEVDKPLEFTFYSGVSLAGDTLENNRPCLNGVTCSGDTFHMKNTVNNSPLFGFGVGYYFTKNLQLEGNFSVAPAIQFRSESNLIAPISDFDVNVVSYNYDGNLVYNFDWKGMRPFLTILLQEPWFKAGSKGPHHSRFLSTRYQKERFPNSAWYLL